MLLHILLIRNLTKYLMKDDSNVLSELIYKIFHIRNFNTWFCK